MSTETEAIDTGAPHHGAGTRSRSVALAAICVVLFLTFLDNTVVSVTLADVQEELHAGVTQLQWIVDGYALAFAGLMLVGGSVGDLLGRRRVMLTGVAIFCAGSVLSALASGSGVLITGRVVMGVGAAASEPGTLSMVRQLFPNRRSRARALGAWAAVSGLALALGPVVGSGLVAIGGWRAIFWFNVALGALALLAGLTALPESADREGRRLDLLGALFGVVAISTLTLAVIQGENSSYTDPAILALFGVAAAALVVFVVVEHVVADPLIDLSFFRRPTFAGANAVAFLTYFGLFAIFFFTALYLQVVSSLSAGALARQFAPMAVAMVLAALLAGRWVAAAGAKIPMTLGCLVGAAGVLWTDSLLGRSISHVTLATSLALAGAGFGIALVPVTSAALSSVPARRSGMAASVTNTSRQLGAVVGVAVLGAVVNAKLTASLQERLRAIGIPAQFQSIVQQAIEHGGVPQSAPTNSPPALQDIINKVIDAAFSAFGDALHICLTLAASLLFLAAALALILVRRLPAGARHWTDDTPTTDELPTAAAAR